MPETIAAAKPKTAAIIGAGIAGACLAQALHAHGVQVTVYDAAPAPAAEASGNPLGLVMLRLDRGHHPAAHFRKQAFLHAVHFYESLGAAGFVSRGVYDYLHDAERRAQLLAAQLFSSDDLYESQQALYHRLAGVIAPVVTIQHLLQHSTLRLNERITSLATLNADVVILTTGCSLAHLGGLPLQHHAGQVNWVRSNTASPTIMADGYVTAHQNQLVFGATFEKWADPMQRPHVTAANTAENINRLQKLLPNAAPIDQTQIQARAAIRVSTPDRLPVVGHVRDNIYALGALGPRGLTLAPLCAASLAAALCQEPLPISAEAWHLLRPTRLNTRV